MQPSGAFTLGQRPLRIFLSSTAQDLGDYRRAVADVIERLGHAQLRMETFGAMPEPSLAECEQLARKADALVVVVGHRYGWVPQPSEGGDGYKSITWREVEAATRAAVPVFRYLCQPGAFADGRDDDGRLEEFRKFLRQFPCDTFASPDDLGTRVSVALGKWVQNQTRDFRAALRLIDLSPAGAVPRAFSAAGLPRLPLLQKVIYASALRPQELAQLVDDARVQAAQTILAQQEQRYAQQLSALSQELATARTQAQNIRKEINSIETKPYPTQPVFTYSGISRTGFVPEFQQQADARAYANAINKHNEAMQWYEKAIVNYQAQQQTLPEKRQLLAAADQHVSHIQFNLNQLTNDRAAVRQQSKKEILLARARDIVALLQELCAQSAQLASNADTRTQGVLLLLATHLSCLYLSEYLGEDAPSILRLEQVKNDVAALAEEAVRQHHQRIGQDCLALLVPLVEHGTAEKDILNQMHATIAALPREKIRIFQAETEPLVALEIPKAEVDGSLIDPAAIALAYADTARKKDALAGSILQAEDLHTRNTALRDRVQDAKRAIDSQVGQLHAHAALGQTNLDNSQFAWRILAQAAQAHDLGPDTVALCAALQFEAERRFKHSAPQLIARYESNDFGLPEARNILAEKFPTAFLSLMLALQGHLEQLKKAVPEFEKALGSLTDLPQQQVQKFRQRGGPLPVLALLPGLGALYSLYIGILVQRYRPAFAGSHPAYQGLRGWALPRLAWAVGISAAGAVGSALARPVIEQHVPPTWIVPLPMSLLLVIGYGVGLLVLAFTAFRVLRIKEMQTP